MGEGERNARRAELAMTQRSRFCAFGASNCHGSTSRAFATFASQSSVGLVADFSTAKTCDRDTPAKSARAVKATPFRFDAKRTFRATSARNSRGSTTRTVERLRHHGIRYPGLFAPSRAQGERGLSAMRKGKPVIVSVVVILLPLTAFLLRTGRLRAACPNWDQKGISDPEWQTAFNECVKTHPRTQCPEITRQAINALNAATFAAIGKCHAAEQHRAQYQAEDTESLRRTQPFTTEEWSSSASQAELDGAADKIRAEAARLKALGDADVGDADGVASLAAQSVKNFEQMATMVAEIAEAEKKCRITQPCMAARAETERKHLAAQAEAKFVGEVALPLCKATINVQQAQADIAREKANPAGVVDLSELHDLGERVQENQDWIKRLSPSYAATRHHAFRGWRSEPACVLGNSNGWDNATDNIVVAPDRQ
jgi:hypothetical protein